MKLENVFGRCPEYGTVQSLVPLPYPTSREQTKNQVCLWNKHTWFWSVSSTWVNTRVELYLYLYIVLFGIWYPKQIIYYKIY